MYKAGFELRIFGLEVKCTTNCAKPYAVLMAVSPYTSAFCALMWMIYCTCRLLKTNFVILKGTAFILSKSHFNLC